MYNRYIVLGVRENGNVVYLVGRRGQTPDDVITIGFKMADRAGVGTLILVAVDDNPGQFGGSLNIKTSLIEEIPPRRPWKLTPL